MCSPRAVRFDDGQVYVPEGCAPNEQRPVILVRTAYSRHLISFPAQRFAERGYLVVVQDVRGRFDSGGPS